MRSRTNRLPKPIRYEPMAEQVVRESVDTMLAWLEHGGPEPRFLDLSEDEAIAVNLGALRAINEPHNPREFVKWMRATQPLRAMPRMDNLVTDMWRICAQDEMLDLWNDISYRCGRRGPKAGTTGSKALLFLTAGAGISAHIDNNYNHLRWNDAIKEVFNLVEAASVKHSATRQPFILRSYSQSLEHLKSFANNGAYEAILAANVRMVQSLRELLSDRCGKSGEAVGRYGLIDGTDWPAWIKQVGTRDAEEHARLRARMPKAGARLIEYVRDGKHSRSEGDSIVLNFSTVKFWRGYYLITLVDQAAGVPIVWVLWDNSWDEAKAIKELLSRLYALWPDAPLEIVGGDAAWDEEWAYEFLEVYYGIHGIFRRKPSARARESALSTFDSEYLLRYTGEGIAYCREHKQPLEIAGFTFGGRANRRPSNSQPPKLLPGDPQKLSDFRVRFRHRGDGLDCGKPSLALAPSDPDASSRWATFPFYPHHPFGLPDRHAFRLAMLARRNACEALHSSLKVGNGLANRGADRLRLEDYERVRMIVSLSLAMKTAFALAEERTIAGAFPVKAVAPLDRFE